MITELPSLINEADKIWTQLTTLTKARHSANRGRIIPGVAPSADTDKFKAIHTALVASTFSAEQQRLALKSGFVKGDHIKLWIQQGKLEDKNKAIQSLFDEALSDNPKVKEAIFPSKNEEGKEDTSK